MAIVILFVRHCAKILWRFNVSTSTMWHISHLSITLTPGGPVAFVPSMDSICFVSLLKSSRFLMLMGTIIGHPTYFQVQKKKKRPRICFGWPPRSSKSIWSALWNATASTQTRKMPRFDSSQTYNSSPSSQTLRPSASGTLRSSRSPNLAAYARPRQQVNNFSKLF